MSKLEETISNLLDLMKSMPEDEIRDRLFNQISCMDSIADVMRQALRVVGPECVARPVRFIFNRTGPHKANLSIDAKRQPRGDA